MNPVARVLLLGVLALLLAVTPGGATSATGRVPAGVYAGPASVSAAAEFAKWSNQQIAYVLDFEDRASWSGIEAPWFVPTPWGTRRTLCPRPGRCDTASPLQLVLSVPLLPNDDGTLRAGAAGAYNAHFRRLALKLARANLGSRTVIRLGWEFNSGWSRWSAASDPAAYAAFYRQVVSTMRQVIPRLRFDWCPAEGVGQFWGIPGGLGAAYPGDRYVDYIGLDTYDQAWGPNSSIVVDPIRRWQQLLTEPGGLQWQARFAATHHKALTYPEWGLTRRADGHGGGDDPYYIQQMHRWFTTHDVAYQIYFNVDADDGDHILGGSLFPAGTSSYLRLFGTAS